MTTERAMILAGERTRTGDVRDILSPWDDRVVARVHHGTAEHLEAAIAAAHGVRHELARLPAHERARILERARDLIAARADVLVEAIVEEAGKPVTFAKGEVFRCQQTFTDAAWAARSDMGGGLSPLDALPRGEGRIGLTRRVPVGPIAAITPFNFPVNLVAHKLAPAVAAGCPIVLKPAPQTPSGALLLAEILVEAGLPPAAISVLPLDVEAADALTTDRRLKMLTFTGSAKVGWALKSRAQHMKVALELGGNAGVYVAADADLDEAVRACAFGGYAYAGQTCISVQRILVHRSVHEAFVERFVHHVEHEVVTGDPHHDATVIGPVIRTADAERIEAWVGESVAAGATLHCGGRREGRLLQPAVLTGVPHDAKASCEEIFGPVVLIEAVDDDATALATLNASRYGLQAGLFTKDVDLVMSAWRTLEVGGVIHGDASTFRADLMPYGGVKDSGLGREGPRHAVLEMTEPRILVLRDGA